MADLCPEELVLIERWKREVGSCWGYRAWRALWPRALNLSAATRSLGRFAVGVGVEGAIWTSRDVANAKISRFDNRER